MLSVIILVSISCWQTATATVAWGVNFPAHLVIVKGTEYYDGKLKRYVDMPITDVLQMIGEYLYCCKTSHVNILSLFRSSRAASVR